MNDREYDYTKLPFRDSDLPIVIRENVSNAPQSRKEAVLITVAIVLMTLCDRLRFKYPFDKVLHALLAQGIIEAPPSTGKRFVDDIVRQIIDPTLGARDEEQRLIEQKYREKKASRKANEKIGEPPQTTIRCLPAATSKTVLNKRADMYKRVLGDTTTFWMYAEELAQLTDAGHQGYSNLRTILRVAYDLGSKFGQDFASDNSYSAISDINFCCLFCATPNDVDEFFNKRSILGGNVTRVDLIQLNDELGAEPAEFKDMTDDQQATIDRTLKLLMDNTYTNEGSLQPTFLLDMSWLYKDIRKWCKEKADEALRAGDTALDVFRRRSSVSACRIAALCDYLYLLDQGVDIRKFCKGEETLPEKTLLRIQKLCRKIYRWSAERILQPMLTRWGTRYNELLKAREEDAQKGEKKTLFDQLTTVFTRDQINLLIRENGMTTESRFFLSQWKAKGWIEKIDKNQFRKLV